MKLEDSLETYLRTGSWHGRENPIDFEDGVAYVRYNSVSVTPATDAMGGSYLRYFLNYMVVGWERVYDDAEGRAKVAHAKANPEARVRVK